MTSDPYLVHGELEMKDLQGPEDSTVWALTLHVSHAGHPAAAGRGARAADQDQRPYHADQPFGAFLRAIRV